MGPEQWLFLQWHEHKGSLVSMFEKLFERNTFVDCTLAAEGQYLNVHKVILSACSPYFELLLNENRDKHPIIILKDVKFRSLKSIIEYMYRGEANVLSSDIKDFLAAAESLQIKGIGKHGGDTKNQPKKALQDFVEGEGRSPHSPKIYPGSGDNDKRTVTDFHEIKSDDEDDESGRDKNFCYIENVEHHSNISPQKIPVPIITSETNAETQWLKAESPEDTAQYLMSMPTLNIGACTTDIVHPGLKETVPERTANKISTQNVLPCDVQMKKAEMSRSETKCELQPASPIVDNEVADSASQASSVRELSDTAEEWAEEEMEEALTHSHTTGNSVVGGTDESRAHFDGGSDATRESRDLGSDQQGDLGRGESIVNGTSTLPEPEQTNAPGNASEDPFDVCPVNHEVAEPTGSQGRQVLQRNRRATRLQTVVQRKLHGKRKKKKKKHESKGGNVSRKPKNLDVHKHILLQMMERVSQELDHEKAVSVAETACSKRSTTIRIDSQALEWPYVPRNPPSSAITSLRPSQSTSEIKHTTIQHKHVCPVCSKTFQWFGHLKRHMQTHRGKKLFKCPKCDYTTIDKQDLAMHVISHMNRPPFICNECKAEFLVKHMLIKHIHSTHGKSKKSKAPKTKRERKWQSDLSEALFQCRECVYATRQPEAFLKHILSHACKCLPKVA